MRFGEYIRIKREENGWTQPEAAAKISVEQSYLSKLETGKSYPSEDVFAKIVSAYSIDVTKMNSDLFSAEIDKLREIGEVRTALLSKKKSQQKFMRGWLITGLVMLMISGASFGLINVDQQPVITFVYKYSSPGIIKKGEDPRKYTKLEQINKRGDLTEINGVMDFKFKEFYERRGDSFVEAVKGGHRIYSFENARPYKPQSPFSWLMPPAVMLLFGAFGCFYISRRWQ
ncbi:helix-turn-helix domain-containing protein [Kordiimonas sp. SCSIO 12603]|uniref:helix-turn-helix domain-containing protein n=1 Tax=Kordiimonas sp. SCSIO 12603 TaxID=2829596 RepID=UPI0021030E45|nr:helix-turn-helix domain-containing protein [Kordiimonas sp. SCSIO 12603]UTW58995.1 helix-turn-helix domain-containing protein [Kordiimonas sp. SCSIO 12603]